MIRKPQNPTHRHGEFELRYGHPLPFGASHVPGGVNFSIYSSSAETCTLALFERGESAPFAEIPFPPEFRMGHVFAMTVYNLDYEMLEYGFRMEGPEGALHCFDREHILLDPYAREIGNREQWMQEPLLNERMAHRGRISFDDFDWGHDRPLDLPPNEIVIYELHVRGFTRHPSSGVRHPGTFHGLQEKAPYLRDLGINCVELMPVFEFDEQENPRSNPLTGKKLCNYWGYSTVGFFAPKSAYAAQAVHGRQVAEFKEMVASLHSQGLEIMLDVVFNHTAEGGKGGPVISFKGIDNRTYYMLESDGSYANFTGCGNTLNCNHPVVRDFVLECLRHWAAEYHVDGFRFDLASVLGRAPDGTPMPNPPLIEALAFDPVLAKCELVAEAWDAAGLYQVGHFPSYGRWSEWNGKYRDAARRFLKGETGVTGELVQRIMGSPDLYKSAGRTPQASVNFITCHDGFTLRDLVSYNNKHNEENGEENQDGANDNNSWNCGVEGPSDDPVIEALRLRQQKNALALLLVSQGIPMLSMGDECGRSQRGNNNAYCQDAEWNWFDWDLIDRNSGLFRFTRAMIAFRKAHPAFRQCEWLTGKDCVGSGFPDISWHGVLPWKPDWTPPSRTIAFMLCGRHMEAKGERGEFLYCAFNSYHEPLEFRLPTLPSGVFWHRFANTGLNEPEDIVVPDQEPMLEDQKLVTLKDRSCVILVGR
jgi:isoamylase